MVTTTPEQSEFSVQDCLARHPFFEALPPADLAALAGRATARRFSVGDMIFMDGDPCAGLWMVEAGSVKVFKLSPEGDEHILHLLGPGSTFNEISALDGGPNPAHAAAMSDAICWLLSSEVLREALHSYPELALSVIAKLTGRVRMLVEHIESLALFPVAARLARFLLQQAESLPEDAPHVSRAAIAAHLATTPETVSRVLRTFEEARAIQFDRHHIVILNPAALRAIANL